MKNITIRQLRVFSEVARRLSFSRVAEELHLTPPAVSMQVKELENSVGMPLFDRSGHSVALTTVGEYMLVYARRVLTALKEADHMVARLKRLDVGTLTIGMVSTAEYFLPRLLTQFRVDHPGVEIRLALGNREQLVQMLQGNEVDLAIMGRPPKELVTRAEPFAAHPHVFIAPPDHPLIRQGHVPAGALAAYGLIVREPGSGTRAAMENFLREANVAPRVVMEMASNETIKQAVMAGMGISLLSLHTLGLELQTASLAIVDVEGAPIVRAWNVVHTLSRTLPPAAEAFRYFVLERGEAYLAEHFGRFERLRKTARTPSGAKRRVKR